MRHPQLLSFGLFHSPCCSALKSLWAASSWRLAVSGPSVLLLSMFPKVLPGLTQHCCSPFILLATPSNSCGSCYSARWAAGTPLIHPRRPRESRLAATDAGMAGTSVPTHRGGEGWARPPEPSHHCRVSGCRKVSSARSPLDWGLRRQTWGRNSSPFGL